MEILEEKLIYNGLGAINHCEARLRLEKVAEENWLEGISAGEFFGQLESIGFYVAGKTHLRSYDDGQEEEWIGIDAPPVMGMEREMIMTGRYTGICGRKRTG